jgi:hypothetical protein
MTYSDSGASDTANAARASAGDGAGADQSSLAASQAQRGGQHPPRSADPATVEQQLLDIAFAQLPQSLLVMTVVVVVFSFVLWGTFSLTLTVSWLVLMSVLIGVRYAMVLAYRGSQASIRRAKLSPTAAELNRAT